MYLALFLLILDRVTTQICITPTKNRESDFLLLTVLYNKFLYCLFKPS